MKRTKIIATVWPATNSEKKLKKLYKSWINVIRFNFSHAKQEDVLKTVNLINKLNASWETNLSLLLDTKWPEIRTWDLETKNIYKKWDIFELYTDENHKLTWLNLFCDYPYLAQDIKVGKIIIVDSWLLNLKVIEKKEKSVKVKALNWWVVWNRRHINLPWVKLNLPWITTKDISDITFAIKNNFDFIAASFIRSGENVLEIRELFKKHNCTTMKIISKVENEEWIENIDSIIKESDWVMVARWDLWIEVPIEKLAVFQKMIVEKCIAKWKFVITATHLLETMIENPFPTRAESSDVFNSVLQWADSLMLSWETAMWKFPIESVEMMTKIIKEAEKNIKHNHGNFPNDWLSKRDIEKKALIRSAVFIWEELKTKAIIILTKTWLLAKLAAAFRPNMDIFSFTNNEKSVRTMNLLYAVKPYYLSWWNKDNYTETLEIAINELKNKGLIKVWQKLVAINDIQKNGIEIPIMEIISVV